MPVDWFGPGFLDGEVMITAEDTSSELEAAALPSLPVGL